MKEKVKFRFDSSIGVLFKNYYDEITVEDIITSWEYAFKNNFITKDVKGVVLDYRNAIIKMQIEENQLIADFYKSHIEVFKGFNMAVISEEPIAVVVSTLLQSLDAGYNIKPFSTLEYAMDWVLSINHRN